MKSKRELRSFVVPAIFIVLILVASVFLYKEYSKRKKVAEYASSIREFQEFSADYLQKTVMPRNIYELFKYKGDFDRDVLYKNMKVFLNFLGYLKLNVNSENAEKYYKAHSSEVKLNTGIETLEDFKVFIQNMEKHNVYGDKYLYAEIVPGSSVRRSNYFLFEINFYYGDSLESDNIEKTTFQVGFLIREDEESPICKYGFAEQ